MGRMEFCRLPVSPACTAEAVKSQFKIFPGSEEENGTKLLFSSPSSYSVQQALDGCGQADVRGATAPALSEKGGFWQARAHGALARLGASRDSKCELQKIDSYVLPGVPMCTY